MFHFRKLKIVKLPRWLLDSAIIFFTIFIAASVAYLVFEKIYENKIYPGVWLGEINLSSKTINQAEDIINEKINNINQSGIIFYRDKSSATVMPVVASSQSDFAYQVIDLDSRNAINQAVNFARDDTFFNNIKNKIKAVAFGHILKIPVSINKEEINKILVENFSQFEILPADAKLNSDFSVSEEKVGKVIDYEKAIEELNYKLEYLDDSSIQLFTTTSYPKIYKKDCLNVEAKAKKIISKTPLTLKYEDSQWIIYDDKIYGWLGLRINNNKVDVGFDYEMVENFLEEEIAKKINREPVDAKFEIKDGKVVEFQESRDGFNMNIEKNILNIENDFIYSDNPKTEIELEVEIVSSRTRTSGSNGFGISEIVGTGESNFSGSPSNRRHNIKNGADALNGLLIKPDEEFSINNSLGEIDAESGYLPELVIKGNKTIAEYGGGLCQIGTTIFRSALQSGLPITMRRSHSYRVFYYEPAGTDATIYSPWPDMKFINNTGNHILIQSRIEGDNLYFDFWGTKDGRTVEVSEPTIYNITKPGETKYIETLDLPVGEEKCTEHAHNGADAYFDYKVVYADGEIKEERISSHYIPWQAVCLIGVEELSETEVEEEIEE